MNEIWEVEVFRKAKTPPKGESINGVNQNLCPQTQPPQLDFDPENTVVSRPLQRIKNSYRNAVIPKKAILHRFGQYTQKYEH